MNSQTSTTPEETDWEALEEEWADELEKVQGLGSRMERYRSFLRIFGKHRMSLIGLTTISVLIVVAALAPVLAPYDPTVIDALNVREAPTSAHLFGTDALGRDVLSRVVFGSRIALLIAITSMGFAFTFGTVLGTLAGYYGGRVDTAVQTAIDLSWSFPAIIMGLALASVFAPDLTTVLAAIAVVYWGIFARLVRGEVLSLKELDYIKSARAIGLSDFQIITRHIVPNAIVPGFVVMTLQMGNAIAVAASLSFLGLGVQPPTPSWGIMLATGREYIRTAWWISAFPGLAIVIVIFAFNFLGEGLRDALDPKIRKG